MAGKQEVHEGIVQLEKGLKLIHKGKYQEAVPVFKALQGRADLPPGLSQRAGVYLRACHRHMAPPPKASTEFGDLLDRIACHLNLGQTAEAAELLKKARKQDPKSAQVAYLEAVRFTLERNTDKAMVALAEALAQDPAIRFQARNDMDLELLHHLEDFRRLIG